MTKKFKKQFHTRFKRKIKEYMNFYKNFKNQPHNLRLIIMSYKKLKPPKQGDHMFNTVFNKNKFPKKIRIYRKITCWNKFKNFVLKKRKFSVRSFFRSSQNLWENHKDKDIQKNIFACERAGHVGLLL